MSQADEDREMQEKLGISDDEMRQMVANERQQDRNNNAFSKSWSDQGREARRVQQEMERGLRSFAEEQVRNRVVSQPQPPATTVQTSSTILTNPAPPPQPKKNGWGGKGQASAADPFVHPFKLSTSVVSNVPKYEIAKGSIQDGTNGDAIDLSALLEEETTATAGYVVIEADVDEDMVVSGWALAIHEDIADAAEVRYTEEAPIRQDKIRLLIGKITLDEDNNPTAWQALFTSVRIIYGLQNGVALKVFEAAPTVASAI